MWQTVLEQAVDGLSVHDVEGRYLWVSAAFEEHFGWRTEQLVGRDAYELIHPDDRMDVRTSHDVVVDEPSTYTVQYRLRQSDDTYQWVESVSRSVPESGGLIAVSTRAMVHHQSLFQAFEHERMVAERLRRLERERATFLSAVAHRARNPITVVLGNSTLLPQLLGDDVDERTRHVIERLIANAEALAELIDTVTTADNLARHADLPTLAPVDLRQLVSSVVEGFASPNGPIHVDIDRPRLVGGDRAQLSLLLEALLHNAVVHTPVGTSVWISVEAGEAETVLVVEDDGPGIPDSRKQEIFRSFAGADEAIRRHDPGLGLGLYVVAEIAALHGGMASVQDRPGGGARFRVVLPRTPGRVVGRRTD